MPFPNFNYCLVCEGVRQELGGKLTILGFYGITPNVEIVVVNQNNPLGLTFIAGFPVIQEIRPYMGTFRIIRPDGSIAFEVPPVAVKVSLQHGGVFGAICLIPPPYIVGRHSVRISVNDEMKLETSFNVRFANPGELAAMGIQVPPVQPPVRPN